MRFPGQRNAKHYFPQTQPAARVAVPQVGARPRWYLVGMDEVLVDIEVHGTAELAQRLGLAPGESVQLSDAQNRRLMERLDVGGHGHTVVAGGSVANTLNNYAFLSGEPAVLLGAIPSAIRPGDPAFAYVAQTPKGVGLQFLKAVGGAMGTAITFITPDGERAFGVAPGVAGELSAADVPVDIVRGAATVLTSLYCLRPMQRPIAGAALAMMEIARDAGVPVAFGLGTAGLVREMRLLVREILDACVTIAAMNVLEAEALTGETDALLAARQILQWVDMVIITEGPQGLTLSGYTDERFKRETTAGIRSKAIPEYNRFEFSRLLRRADCERPLEVHSHIHPYRGGPDLLRNTSGAGDAALAAVLHDIAANHYHRTTVPDSAKHADDVPFLTYSSLSRNAQYGNRVAYEVLQAHSPRLDGPVGHDDVHPFDEVEGEESGD